MPKAKPSQVIVHRIELQEKEREALETIVMGKTIESVSKSASMLVTGVGLGFMAYAGYWTLEKVFKWADDAEDWMKGKWELINTTPTPSPLVVPDDVREDLDPEYKPEKLGIFFPFNQYLTWLP
jgi:hypothetical protein